MIRRPPRSPLFPYPTLFRSLVANPQPPADIEVPDVEAASLEYLDEPGALLDGLGEGGELGDLGPYMLVNPDKVHAPVLPHPFGERERLVYGDAELVEGAPGGDVLVGLGVHVRVDPQGDPGPLAVPAGEPIEVLELRGGLDVEEQDALSQTRHKLLLRLADPGEDDLFRVEPSAHRPVEFSDGDDVRPGPEGCQSVQNGEVPVRLHRVAHQVIEARERLVQLPVRPLQGRVAVDVDGGPCALGYLGERHALAAEDARLVLKFVQWFYLLFLLADRKSTRL